MIQRGSGHFEYNIDNKIVFTGRIMFFDTTDSNTKSVQLFNLDKTHDNYEGYVLKDEIYTQLENKGYCLGKNYKNIVMSKYSEKEIQGYVEWKNDWIYFLDGLLKFTLLENLETGQLNAPVSIREMTISPAKFKNIINKGKFIININSYNLYIFISITWCSNKQNIFSDINVSYNILTKEITCDAVKIIDVKNDPLILSELGFTDIKLEEKAFVQFDKKKCGVIDKNILYIKQTFKF